MPDAASGHHTAKQRLGAELKSYLVISGYLLICFSIILFYQAALLPEKSAGLVAHGFALCKALVLGKFILIGNALDVGSRMRSSNLLHRVAWKTLGLLAVLVVFTIIEEVVVAMVHGGGAGNALAELAERPFEKWAAPMLLMLLILIPLTATSELNRAMGEGRLKALFLGKADNGAQERT